MRFKSKTVDGFQVFAVTGINTVSFGIQATASARKGLLGFAVERADPTQNENFVMPGFKVFRSRIPQPVPHIEVSTWDHPVQSLVRDDFTGTPELIDVCSYPSSSPPRPTEEPGSHGEIHQHQGQDREAVQRRRA